MSLKTYHEKRRFDKTTEPEGHEDPQDTSFTYIIQKHAASHLHYDFRLALNGVLKSWAIPKGPSYDPAVKHLAVEVEDHPLDYAEFEGTIPAKQYGGGTVMLWDRGTWEPIGNPEQSLKKGKLVFKLHGEKLKGQWTLLRVRSQGSKPNWLLLKNKDQYAHHIDDNVLLATNSVKTGRSLADIAGDITVKASKHSAERKPKMLAALTKKNPTQSLSSVMPTNVSAQLATLVKSVPKDDGWIYEIKFDGYRLLGFIEHGNVRLLTRNGNDWTHKFPAIVKALSALPVQSAIVDGEVVALDNQGVSRFQLLQNAIKQGSSPLYYQLFDLMYCDGVDLRSVPLLERKAHLKQLFAKLPETVLRYSDHLQGEAVDIYKKACSLQLEGLIAKRASSKYTSKRTEDWLKIKCMQRQEFVIVGYTDPAGAREYFGSLLLGYYDQAGHLIYSGRVGTGFNQQTLREIYQLLQQHQQSKTAVYKLPKIPEVKDAHWLRPQLVCEIEFSEWTDDGRIRHPSFKGLREDKRADQVYAELPANVDEIAKPSTKNKQVSSSSRWLKNYKNHKIAGISLRDEGILRGENRDSFPLMQARIHYVRRIKSREGGLADFSGNSWQVTNHESTLIAGVTLSHPDKLYFSKAKISKLDLANYYHDYWPRMDKQLCARPLAILRCPDGIDKACFYQKHIETLPPTVGHVSVTEKHATREHMVIKDEASVMSLVQFGALELHTWSCLADDIEKPDRMIFDLDPDPGLDFKAIVEAARVIHAGLEALGLPSFVKTSGKKGLHVVVPLKRKHTWEEVKLFSKAMADRMADLAPEHYIATTSKAKRKGKILIDYLRNERGATCVAAYSTRATETAAISTPLGWDELDKLKSAADFNLHNIGARLQRIKQDPWHNYHTAAATITAKMWKQMGIATAKNSGNKKS